MERQNEVNELISLSIGVSDQVAQGAAHVRSVSRSGRGRVTNSPCAPQPITSRGGIFTVTYLDYTIIRRGEHIVMATSM